MGDVGWRQEGGGGVKRSVCTVLRQTLPQKPGSRAEPSLLYLCRPPLRAEGSWWCLWGDGSETADRFCPILLL